jgi:hypothetical protein
VTSGGGGALHHSQHPLIGCSEQVSEWSTSLRWHVCPHGPHLPYIVLRDGVRNPGGLGSPDHVAESRARLCRWTESVEIDANNLNLRAVGRGREDHMIDS